MRPTKAAGSDGFPTIFSSMSLELYNVTNIVVILKIDQPTNLSNFRPISLCTVLYKIISKTTANRFQKVS
ncbi:reverse transcriptase [Gossypium australe]|uniref:Reverse transcriptase n=1 Tax=Gossypium australe TaxID=47621 RepID=A0A5B6VA24_9ROSI|nr:reverse transcriptase [Gossypium australe]